MQSEQDIDSEEQLNQRAARVLANLIRFGVASEPPESLPPDWQTAYEAVRRVPPGGFVPRQQAFLAAIADSPFHLHMELEVDQAVETIQNHPQDQLRVYSAWETLAEQPDLPFTVEGVFTRGSVNALVGAPGSKKTWTILDLAVCVASGQPWLGHCTTPAMASETEPDIVIARSVATKQSHPLDLAIFSNLDSVGAHGNAPADASSDDSTKPDRNPASRLPLAGEGAERSSAGEGVLILDEEGGLTRMWDRMRRAIRGHSAPADIPLYFIPPSFYNLSNSGVMDSLAARVRSLGVGLIIIDALTNAIPRTDENNVLSIQPIFDNLRYLARQTGATVLVVHHTNKQGLVRGSTLIASSVDHLLAIESEPSSDLIQLSTLKARDLPPVSLTARASFTKDTFALEPAPDQPKVKLSRSARAILNTIGELGSASSNQLTSASLASSTTRGLIHELVAAGLVERCNPGAHGTPALYQLTILGESLTHPHPQNQQHLPLAA